jgi:hypothetical protein
MTASRPSMQKSMSKSGIDTRSGFRNRSNSSRAQRIEIGDAERVGGERARRRSRGPGPTGIAFVRAHAMKSATIRKYPSKPIFTITSSSRASRSR